MTNEEWAQAIFAAYVAATRKGKFVWTYGDMAKATGRSGQHRLMGPALDLVRERCTARGVPDCATLIVTQDALNDGSIRPSQAALKKHSGWAELRKEQAACLTFDWSSVD